MPTNEEIIEELKEENTGRVWEFDEPALTKALNKARAEGYKQGQIDAVKHLFENKIAIVRAVKVLSEDMQDVAKKAGYKPDDVLFITMEKIEGGMVIKGSVVKCESDELVIKKVD